MILPPPLLRDADGTLRLSPVRIEALDTPRAWLSSCADIA
jgi:hypothetical protein